MTTTSPNFHQCHFDHQLQLTKISPLFHFCPSFFPFSFCSIMPSCLAMPWEALQECRRYLHQGPRYMGVLHPRTEATDVPSCVTVNYTQVSALPNTRLRRALRNVLVPNSISLITSAACHGWKLWRQRGHQLGIHCQSQTELLETNRTLITHMLQTELSNAPAALLFLICTHVASVL